MAGQDIVIRSIEYDGVPFVDIPLQDSNESARFIDTSDATLSAANQMLDGITSYADGVKITGNIPSKNSSNLSANGATVTVPAGNYAEQATKTIDAGSATAPATISGTSASLSTGNNTLTLSKTISNTPQVQPGYVASGTAGNSAVSLTASVTTKAAATITPGTTNQEIAADTYLTGKQTISGDANLQSAYIVQGKSIFGVQGSAVVPIISQDSSTHGLSIS